MTVFFDIAVDRKKYYLLPCKVKELKTESYVTGTDSQR